MTLLFDRSAWCNIEYYLANARLSSAGFACKYPAVGHFDLCANFQTQVLEANLAAFSAINQRFQSLCSAVLPGMSLRLVATDSYAAEGVKFEFKRNVSKQDSDVFKSGWCQTLDQLSGGQRSLVSLALLLAAAGCGGRTSLFLLDEVNQLVYLCICIF